jgi:hypothetical protein
MIQFQTRRATELLLSGPERIEFNCMERALRQFEVQKL